MLVLPLLMEKTLSKQPTRRVVLFVCLMTVFGAPARAQQTAANASAAAQASAGGDDAALRPAEPDFRLINLPTTLRLPLFKSNFVVTHRFNGNLRNGSFTDQLSTLFGIDEGAMIGLEYRIGVARHLQAVVYRTSFNKTIQFIGKYDPISQSASTPVSISALVSVEGIDNFQEQYAPSLGAVVSRAFDDVLAVYATPIWVHNSAAALAADQNTFVMGFGGRARIRPTVYVVGEFAPRAGGFAPGDAEYSFGIEKRAGLHMFQLNFSNSQGSTYGQLARGGFPNTLYLGFNLARKFY